MREVKEFISGNQVDRLQNYKSDTRTNHGFHYFYPTKLEYPTQPEYLQLGQFGFIKFVD